MDARIYQEMASRTLISKPDFDLADSEIMLIWTTIGLAGEAGEVAEHIKKGIFHQHGIDPEKLKKELGDVLWYVAAICETAGFDMGAIMQANIDKLKVRYPNGYSSDDSKARVDTVKRPAADALVHCTCHIGCDDYRLDHEEGCFFCAPF